ncbi:hypothetical protein [Mesorhizobium xinjiangense]|uniref:hypothetical protein n=1 Tax=Mesorhizobium xinjiangense TaxID=2678685 RepID=UPI0018DB7B76|nr:hypothetical protein [Mesorhizobium xinjiangense]
MNTTRRNLLLTATGLAATAASLKGRSAHAADQMADFLFVQTADGMRYDKAANRLTLEGVSGSTLFFSDRPERIAGNMKTAAFIPFWSKGGDSFLSDPPNADLSILEGDELKQVVVVLENPELNDNNLTYTVKVVGGEMPETGSEASVFIDIIGMPLTPLSYAGVARRGYRRAVLH